MIRFAILIFCLIFVAAGQGYQPQETVFQRMKRLGIDHVMFSGDTLVSVCLGSRRGESVLTYIVSDSVGYLRTVKTKTVKLKRGKR
jgi:hypothetical protein